jgi:hypothetical protein
MTQKMNDVPTLRLSTPDPKTSDCGKVRYGDVLLTAGTPRLSPPDPAIADPGKVRYGDVLLTAGLPPLR